MKTTHTHTAKEYIAYNGNHREELTRQAAAALLHRMRRLAKTHKDLRLVSISRGRSAQDRFITMYDFYNSHTGQEHTLSIRRDTIINKPQAHRAKLEDIKNAYYTGWAWQYYAITRDELAHALRTARKYGQMIRSISLKDSIQYEIYYQPKCTEYALSKQSFSVARAKPLADFPPAICH